MGNLGLDDKWKFERGKLVVGDHIAVIKGYTNIKGKVVKITKSGLVKWRDQHGKINHLANEPVFRLPWADELVRSLVLDVDRKQRLGLLVPRNMMAIYLNTMKNNGGKPRIEWR